jgi:ADP-ribose pyrophosphatase YjhB (NUDIX family)
LRPRFCLRCGRALGRVRDGAHVRPRCPGCGWIFYENPVPAAVALVVRGGKVLFTRRANEPYAGTWDVPGGFMEAGEAPAAAVDRELREELGVGARTARFVGFATDRYGPRGFSVLTIVYRVTLLRRYFAGSTGN